MVRASLSRPDMNIVMLPDATEAEVAEVVERFRSRGAEVSVSNLDGRIVVSASVEARLEHDAPWESFPGVDRVVSTVPGGRLVGRAHRSDDSVVSVGRVTIGAGAPTVIAGPCAAEGREQLLTVARAVRDAGAQILRGDAFKPRTSPYSFQGLGKLGLEILSEARDETGLPFVAEVLDPREVDLVASYADMVRIGTRNMSNHALLREVGRQPKPVLLKRGRAATVAEWVDAAEYVYREGNTNIVLVERGVRSFDDAVRNMLDLAAVPIAKSLTHLPVMVDPSHAAGRSDLVIPLARAAVAVGADGLLIDVHHDPASALVDGAQALLPEEFAELMVEVGRVAGALGRV